MTRYDSKAAPEAGPRSVGRNAEGREITPMEAVLSKADVGKLHEIAEATPPRHVDPVRMDGLRAAPSDLLRTRTPDGVIPGGDGTSLPLVPRKMRTIPAPYRRSRVDWDDRHHGKTWHYAAAETVESGDIIVDFGRVAEIAQREIRETIAGFSVPVRSEIVLVNIIGGSMAVEPFAQLRVFRVPKDELTADNAAQ